jgi:multiple sugar transport system ATP-binding protein
MAIAPIVVFGWFSQKQLVRADLRRRQVTFTGDTTCPSSNCTAIEKHFGRCGRSRASTSRRERRVRRLRGPSGCGKSTLLRMIAGLTEIDGGRLHLDGRDITQLPVGKRDLAMVFQSYALYPHMSVADNMSFALRLANVDKAVIREKVQRAAEILNLTQYLQRTPKELSGGPAPARRDRARDRARAQGVPVRRAALEPRRRAARPDARRDREAAPRARCDDDLRDPRPGRGDDLADRVVVLRDGAIEQVGSPLELYDRPANRFVAQFIGTPQMNLIDTAKLPALREAVGAALGTDGFIGVRPENVGGAAGRRGALRRVELVESLGADTLISASVAARVAARRRRAAGGAPDRAQRPAPGRCGRARHRARLLPRVRPQRPSVATPRPEREADAAGRTPGRSADARHTCCISSRLVYTAHQAVYLIVLRGLAIAAGRSLAATSARPRRHHGSAFGQRGAYTLDDRSPAGERRYERIESIREVIPFDASLARLIEVGAEPSTRIVSSPSPRPATTSTPTTGSMPASPTCGPTSKGRCQTTIYGALARSCALRRERGGAPVTLLNCDNLRATARAFAPDCSTSSSAAASAGCSRGSRPGRPCPSAMVDRITPRPPADVAERVRAATGWDDHAPVMAESFIQWVVEDRLSPPAVRPGSGSASRWSSRCMRTRRPRSASSMRRTASVAWAAPCAACSTSTEDMAVPEIREMAFDYVTDDVIPVA